MADIKSRKFEYTAKVEWAGQKKGLLSSEGKSSFSVATPPEFHGHSGIWTPEDLFVSAVNSCIMTTFLFFAEKQGLELLAYSSTAQGTLEKAEGKFKFTQITLRVDIKIKLSEQVGKARKLIEQAEKNCLISNSVTSKINLEPVIISEE